MRCSDGQAAKNNILRNKSLLQLSRIAVEILADMADLMHIKANGFGKNVCKHLLSPASIDKIS